ncbi:MAG: hypothetical protein QOI65_2109 [Thermoleophilaceae bacterium]|nr:hypothetical protein [Thermoleophilaceae bacterium]MEA2353069.1 hypothetical protein [Thermoleophilaceae bacterium]
MGVWTWIKDTIAYQGEAAPLPIDLERAGDGDYVFRLGVRAGFGGGEAARLPIHHRPNVAPHPVLKEIYSCEVAGQTLEAANLFALRDKVGSVLETIAPARALPLAYFRVPAVDYSLPVYEDDGQIVSPVLAGPRLKARDLAGIRRAVCRYLLSAGYVDDESEVTVGVLRPRDLRLVGPAAIFRSQTDPDFWLPTVEGVSAEGPVIGVLANAARLSTPERRRAGAGPLAQDTAPADADLMSLLRLLRADMSHRHDPEWLASLYASEVRPEIWESVEARTEDSGSRLVAYLTDDEGTRLELGVRRIQTGDVCAAFADTGINAFLADSEDALASMVGTHLHRSGFLRFPQEIEIHAAEAPRAERLDTEAIWTHEEVPT